MSQFLTSLRRFRLIPFCIGWLEILFYLAGCSLMRVALSITSTESGAGASEFYWLTFVLLAMGVVFFIPVYAALRYSHTLPVGDGHFRDWIAATPWTSDRALPWGSPFFHYSDLLLLVVISAGFAIAPPVDRLSPAIPPMGTMFLLAGAAVFVLYVLSRSALLLMRAKSSVCTWIIILAYPIQLFYAWNAISGSIPALLILVLVTVMQLVAQEFALKQIIRDLSKALYACDDEQNEFGHMRKYGPQGAGFGWPFTTLSPLAKTGRVISVRDGLLGALCLGMITFVFAQLQMQSGENVRAANGFLWFCTVVFVLVRFALYLPAFTSPVVRYKTGRWIIPREDRVFVAPLLALLAAGVCSALLTNQPLTLAPWVAALWSTCVPAIIFLVGPNLLDHKLTTSICMSGKSIWLAKPVESKRARRSPTVRSILD
ncbi:MAG: hypothetical protein R3C18_25055 [Planctomycetaceae bacterium]